MKASGVAGVGPAVIHGEGGASGGVEAARGDGDPMTSAALVVFRDGGGGAAQGALKASGVAGIGPAVVDGEGGAVDGEGGASGGVKATCGDSDPVTSVALVVCIQVVANEISKAISNESSYESHI